MFKQFATACAAVTLGLTAFSAPAEAYTKACGSTSVVMERDSQSPRYFNGAFAVQLHRSGSASYHMPSNYVLSVTGRWYFINNGSSVVVVNPDGSRTTFHGATNACTSYF